MSVAAIKSLDLADEHRHDGVTAAAFDLWLAAKQESNGSRVARLQLFRHAMIHAGYVMTKKGCPYRRCPQCHHTLNR